MLMIKYGEIIMKKVQSTLFQSWGTKVSSTSKTNLIDEIGDEDIADLDDVDLDDETLLAACQEWDSSGTSKNAIVQGTPLENLPGFDISSGHIWIYPTNMPVRDYQMNIVEQSLLKNTLVTLPTGLGKTFIAAVVMYNFYRWYPSGKIVFMAPTKPLVAQQIEACYNIMGIPQKHTAEMTGSMHPPERKRVWQSRRVFFLTPQVLMNDLSRKACPADDIKCLVVDEAHKALGNHSYCQVVRELSKYTINFRVLALSATPGSDLKAVQQVLTNLMIAHIEIRSEEAPDIQKYVHNRKIDKYVVPLGKELEAIQEKYLRIITMYVDKLYRTKCLYSRNPKSLTKYQVLMCRDAFRKDPPQHMQRAQIGVAEGEFAILISLYHGYELLLQHGMHSLHCFLTSMVDGSKGTSRARNELMQNHGFNDLMGELERKFKGETEETELANRSFSSSLVKTQKRPFVYSHPKLKKLEEVVLEHFDQHKNGGKMNTRVMIFTQYRDSVNEISTMLNQHKPTIKCMPFVGQSSAGKSTKGVTQKEQLRVVREFRAGGYNTIVSTCVGEEGLDIGEVDLIVCYDVHKSPIRLVQRMGRTGRKRHGRIVMLVTEGKEETVYNQGFYNNKGIQKALHGNTKNLQLYHNNPRMVPKGLNPKIHQMYLTVASAYKNKNDMKSARSSSNQTKINNQTCHGPKRKNDAFLSEEELKFWNLHYKLDDHQKASVKTIPSGGRFITIGDKTSKKKTLASEFSLSEWSLWQTKKQPFKFVDHSKRCKNFVEVEEFIEVQGFVEGEDVYGMEMATFLNKDDIIKKRKSRMDIQRFCVNEQIDSNDASPEENNSGEMGDRAKSKSKKGTSCPTGNQDKRVSLSDHDIDVNQEMGDGISKNKDFVIDNSECANASKEDLELRQKSGGKRKKKTKHLTPVQYSDDDDFEFKGDLLKSIANNRHKEKRDMCEGISDIDNALIHRSGKVLVPDVVLEHCKSTEVEELDETLLPFDPSYKEPSPDDHHDNDQNNQHLDDHHNHDQYNIDKHDDDLSVIFPCTQARTEKRSLPFADEISPKQSVPPPAPNISSLDFLDDIDDLELSRQLSIQPIDDHLQYLDKSCKNLNEICETSYNKQFDEAAKGERMTGRSKVSEGISIVQVNPSKSISDERSSANIIDKEITEIENYVDSEWDFEWSDVEDEKIKESIDKEGSATGVESTHQIDKLKCSNSIPKLNDLSVDTSPKHDIFNQIDNKKLLECRTKICMSSRSINKESLSKDWLESNSGMNILIASELCSSKPVKKRTLEEQKKSTEQKRMLPGQKGTIPEQNMALPEQKKTLSEQKMTLPEQNIMLPEQKISSSDHKKMLKEQKRTLPDQKKNLPQQEMTSQEQSQGFSPCLFSENFIKNKTDGIHGIEELYPQLEIESQEVEKYENKRIVIDENIKTKSDSTDKEFDLQFDLDDFLNDDDEDDEEDDDDIIPPTPAKFNNLSGKSQSSQLLLGKISVKPVYHKLQKNVDEFESRSIFESKSSTPKPSLLNDIHSKVPVASAESSCDSVHSNSCKTSSLFTLQSSTDSTSFRPKSSLTHSKLQSEVEGLNFLKASNDAPDAKKQVKCIPQTSILFDEKENHKGSDVESKGIKRKSDSFSSLKNDSQKKRKVLPKDLELAANDDIVCRNWADKSDSATRGPKAQLIDKNYEEDDEIGDDSEDEIQTKRRNKKNVLSSPVFKTPIKPVKRSKYIVVSSDSDDDKISSDELPSPLGERLLKKSGLSSSLLDNFKNDDEDFQDFADVHKKLTTPAHRKRVETNSRIIKHRRDKDSNKRNNAELK